MAGHINYSMGMRRPELQDTVDFWNHPIPGKYCQKSKHCMTVTIAVQVKRATTNLRKQVLHRMQIQAIGRGLTAYKLQNTPGRKKTSCIIVIPSGQKGN